MQDSDIKPDYVYHRDRATEKGGIRAMPSVMEAPIRLKRTAGNVGEIADLREKALSAFLEKLQLQEGENLLKVVLFGSVARGDSRPDSDIDLFVLVKEGTRKELRDRIVDLSIDVNLEEGDYKICLSPFIKNWDDYLDRKRIGLPIFYNMEKEGIVLYDIEE